MNKLYEALRNINWHNPQESFAPIANILMGEYVIQKGNCRYAIVEIEFYAFSKDHKDFITYPRTIKCGRWYFHQSGVDLTFESICDKNELRFGGVLIRGLYKLNQSGGKGTYVFGPKKCVNELWDDFDAFDSSDEYPIIVNASAEDNLSIDNIINCKRCININKELRRQKIIDWAKRVDMVIHESDLVRYEKEMFITPTTQLYRFFNLHNGENPYTFSEIPALSRPQKLTLPI